MPNTMYQSQCIGRLFIHSNCNWEWDRGTGDPNFPSLIPHIPSSCAYFLASSHQSFFDCKISRTIAQFPSISPISHPFRTPTFRSDLFCLPYSSHPLFFWAPTPVIPQFLKPNHISQSNTRQHTIDCILLSVQFN